ncbi:MAG: glycoside hydrolase family 3 protein [Anaerolineae bacterium]
MKRGFVVLFLTLIAAMLILSPLAGGSLSVAMQTTSTATVVTTATTAPTLAPTLDSSALYLDATAPIEDRIADLLARMTIDEKIGQMVQVEKGSISPDDIRDLALGSLLSGGGGAPSGVNSAENWAKMVDGYQKYALETRLAIPLIYGVDAVHGHSNVYGATIFPHNIGLGATRDADLLERIGRATAEEMIATGIYWNFAPCVAVVQDVRWGRSYESYSENPAIVSELATAYIKGLQTDHLGAADTVIATAKHFVGDGGTAFDSSTTYNGATRYSLDQGVTEVDEATLRAIHLPPYEAAIKQGALSIMASFSSWDGLKMHAQKYLLTDVLKGELGFTGFVVSDWGGIDQISKDYYTAVVTSINAGVDMNMVPQKYPQFIKVMQQAVEKGDISVERIDDAVTRILRAKFKMGLFEHPFSDPEMLQTVGSAEHRALAREAVAKSQVLLKNEGDVLPLSVDTPLIFIAGEGADNIGIQSGGWTISWQGSAGNITVGTTIREGIEQAVGANSKVIYDRLGRFRSTEETADVGIVVVSELPYAEGVGDSKTLELSTANVSLVNRVRERVKKLIVIVVSGRPLIINDQVELADAVVAAWLPGTEGAGVADVLFGKLPFTGKLSVTWMRSVDQLPVGSGTGDALYPFGYGLTTTAK